MGALVSVDRQRVELGFLLAATPGFSLLFAFFSLGTDSAKPWWQEALLGGEVGAIIGLIAALIIGVVQKRARKRGLEVRRYEHGLVVTDSGRVVSGRWNALRLSRSEQPRHTYHWTISAPDGRVKISDTVWTDIGDIVKPALEARAAQWREAQATLARGDAWDFSGWELTRWGVRTPAASGRWGDVAVRVSCDATGHGWIWRVTLHGAGGRTLDQIEVEDAKLIGQILEPFAQVLGRT